MDIPLLLLNVSFFLIAIFLCFYIPGKVLVAYCKLKLTSLETYIFSLAFGLVTFTFICYIFDSFHILHLMYPTLILFLFLFVKNKLWTIPSIERIDRYPFLFIIILSLIFSYPLLLSGVYADGVHLININATDSTFHLSLINELQHRFPPDHPGFASAKLSGYHMFTDYVWAKVIQIFHINLLFLFFQYEPVFTAILWGTGVYLFMKRWTKSVAAGLWAVFLTMFGGSFVFLMHVYGQTKPSLDSGFGMLQPSMSLINPPFATSIVIIIFALFSLFSYIRTKEKGWIVPLVLFFGLAAEFKVYAGILLLGGFCIFLLINVVKKQFRFIGIFLGILFVFTLTYLRLAGKGGFLIYYPYWAPIDMVRSNLSFMNYDNQMYVYGQYRMIHRIVWLHIRIFCMFLFGNLGSRMIGLLALYFYPQKKALFFSSFTFTLFCMMLMAFFIPLFCIQSIKPFEITQMFNYFLFFASLFAAIGFMSLFSIPIPKFVKVVIFLIIIIITLQSFRKTYDNFLPMQQPTVTKAEYQGMKFLEKQGNYDATVLVLPQLNDSNSFSKQDTWVHNTNMIVPALVNKRGYFNDENITYPEDVLKRVALLSEIATVEDVQLAQQGNMLFRSDILTKLHDNHIAFIYSFYKLPVIDELKLKQIYTTQKTYVYKVL